jgi:hypothetical protein
MEKQKINTGSQRDTEKNPKSREKRRETGEMPVGLGVRMAGIGTTGLSLEADGDRVFRVKLF